MLTLVLITAFDALSAMSTRAPLLMWISEQVMIQSVLADVNKGIICRRSSNFKPQFIKLVFRSLILQSIMAITWLKFSALTPLLGLSLVHGHPTSSLAETVTAQCTQSIFLNLYNLVYAHLFV